MNKQRRKALETAMNRLEAVAREMKSIQDEITAVRDDEQEAFDNLSENAQQGDNGQAIEAAKNGLDEAIDLIAGLEFNAIVTAINESCDTDGAELPAAKLSQKKLEERREARLPQWAKQRITTLEEQVKTANDRAASMFGEPDPTKKGQAVVGDHVGALRGKAIPASIIEFPGLKLRVSYDRHDNALEISKVGFGLLKILPVAANSCKIASNDTDD